MVGRFGDQVTHLPTGKRGEVVMHPSGSIGVFSTAVRLDNGRVEEFPDSELRIATENGAFQLTGVRFASSRSIPAGMLVELRNNGDGTVTVTGQVPGGRRVTLHNLPIHEGEIVLPDEAFLPVHQ